MKRQLYLTISLGFLAFSNFAHGSDLCIYNATKNSMQIEINAANINIPSLSSQCKDNLDNDQKLSLTILSPDSGNIEVDQSKSNDKKMLTNQKLRNSKNLVYDLESGNYSNRYTIYDKNEPIVIPTSNWLSHISDDKTLNEIVIPGSHDAGMSETHHCTFFVRPEWVQAQKLNIYQQAMAGVRYFDLRADYDHHKLVTFHRTDGTGCNGESLKDVFDQAVAFLTENPSEFLILKFSHTRNDSGHSANDTQKRVIQLLENDKYKAFLYTSSVKTNLGYRTVQALRGKILAVFKHHDDTYNSGTSDQGYQDYLKFSDGILPYQDKIQNDLGLNVYDRYADTSDYNKMLQNQKQKWKDHAEMDAAYEFLLSFTLTGSVGKLDIEQIANTANGHLPTALYQSIILQGYNKPNIVYYDFVDPKLSESIIRYNFD